MINNYFSAEDYHHSDAIYVHPIYHTTLHIGDMAAAIQIEYLEQISIRTVITAAAGMEHIEYEPQTMIKHIVYPLLDIKSQNIGKLFNTVHQLFQKLLQQGSVLVHCAAGVSRSATLVIAYLMKQKMWGFKDSIAFVRQNRPKVCPNLGFQRQLKEYQKTIFKVGQKTVMRRGSKTSEEHKHGTNKNIQLPQLGRAHIKSIVLNPFGDKTSALSSHRNRRSEVEKKQQEEFPFRLKPLKLTRKTKSLVERPQLKTERVRQAPGLNCGLGVQSVFINRVNVGDSHTERLVRKRHIFRFQQINNPM